MHGGKNIVDLVIDEHITVKCKVVFSEDNIHQ